MPECRTFTIDDLCRELPDVTLAESEDFAAFDVLFTSLGFEDRCVAVSRLLGNPPTTTYMLFPSTNTVDNQRNLNELEQRFRRSGAKFVELHAERSDTSIALEHVFESESFRRGNLRCAIDVSVMPSRFMIPLLNRLLASNVQLTVLYTMPETYKPTDSEFQEKAIEFCESLETTTEEGVADIIPSLSLPGQHVDHLPAKLILFPNFRRQRSMAVVTDVDESLAGRFTDQLVWFLTKPLDDSFLWRLDAVRRVNGIQETCHCSEIEPLDYKDTILNLERIYADAWRSHNISISPLGTKMQRLGVAIFNYCRPSTRLIFSRPMQYNANVWSEGISDTYAVRLGDTQALRRKLRDVGALRVFY